MRTHRPAPVSAPPSRGTLAFIGFLIAAGFFFVTEHRAHLYGAWPLLFILLCPLMHLFMHGGHGHGGAEGDDHESGAGPHNHGGVR